MSRLRLPQRFSRLPGANDGLLSEEAKRFKKEPIDASLLEESRKFPFLRHVAEQPRPPMNGSISVETLRIVRPGDWRGDHPYFLVYTFRGRLGDPDGCQLHLNPSVGPGAHLFDSNRQVNGTITMHNGKHWAKKGYVFPAVENRKDYRFRELRPYEMFGILIAGYEKSRSSARKRAANARCLTAGLTAELRRRLDTPPPNYADRSRENATFIATQSIRAVGQFRHEATKIARKCRGDHLTGLFHLTDDFQAIPCFFMISALDADPRVYLNEIVDATRVSFRPTVLDWAIPFHGFSSRAGSLATNEYEIAGRWNMLP